jgi:hypothetical protein
MQPATEKTPHSPIALRTSHRLALARARVVLDQGGQALVEFVIFLPLLLLGAFIAVHLEHAQNSAQDQKHLADVVARYVAVNQNPGEAQGLTLRAWAKKHADNDIAQHGRICIEFPEGTEITPEHKPPVVVEFKGTAKWLPDIHALSVIDALGGIANVEIAETAVFPLEQKPSPIGEECE